MGEGREKGRHIPRPVSRDAVVQVHVDAGLQHGAGAGEVAVDADPGRDGMQHVAAGAGREAEGRDRDGACDGAVAGARQHCAGPV